jgi:SEC-C motif-containing protein
MRSRYSAFALGLGDYLVRTLSGDHPDRAHDEAALARELSHVKDRQRFLGLEILETSTAGDTGQVRFFARVFERGANRSFEETSTFRREGTAWRYVEGSISGHGDKP